MSATNAAQLIRILHLSDIHFRASKSWDSDPVLRALTAFIGESVEADGPPDLVAFTGDLAFSGLRVEYRLAQTWLDQLWPKLGSPSKDRLLLVPGNHDVDRGKVDFTAESVQSSLLGGRDQQKITTILGDRKQRAVLLKRHGAYTNFLKSWFGEAHAVPWWRRIIEIRGCRLHVAGLDSAWMACGDQDSTRLLVGRYQLTQTVETAEAGEADWRLVLMHHPWEDLAEFDRQPARDTVHRHSDLLLRGHLHHPHPEYIRQPDPARTCLELPTGCIYDNSQYPNAFQWIELSPPPAKRARVRFCLWDEGAWIIDKNRGDNGWWDVDLAAPPPSRSSDAEQAVPDLDVPVRYVDWLRRKLERVELLGTKEGRSVTLNSVYVPAVTKRDALLSAIEATVTKKRAAGRVEREADLPALLIERLDRESLYVAAPAGAGKSTFCRWAALQSISGVEFSHPVPAPENFAEPIPKTLRGRLPLLVPLREFWRGMNCGRGEREWKRSDLERSLADWIDASPPDGLTGAHLQAHLEAGTALLLLDGLDEVAVTDNRDKLTLFPRDLFLSGLADALPVWLEAGNRILLTSRPYGLDQAGLQRLRLPTIDIEPLPDALQNLFVRRWFHTLGKPEKIEGLIATIRNRGDLTPLVENPMLLTAICVLYDNGGQLPEDRYELYKSIVSGVLYSRYPGEASQRDPVERRLEAIALGMHVGDDEAKRDTPAAEVSWAELERLLGAFARLNPVYETDQVEVAVRREDLLNRSGLLLPAPNERARFYHLSFQEFMAAQRLSRTAHDVEQVFRARRGVPEWRATLLFLFVAQIANRDAGWGLRLLGRLLEDQDRAAVKYNPVAAALVAEALDLCLTKNYQVPEDLEVQFRQLALDAIEDEVELQSRQALGLCLGRLGDPRICDLHDRRAYVEVPAGAYPYGDKNETVDIPVPFLLCRYPVTNSQYRAFLNDGGYRNPDWWSEEGWKWRQKEGITEPRLWRDRRWTGPNQPVVGVTFWEAEACCAWAGGRLPKEREWEAAARGEGGLVYPWGNDWQGGICNSAEAGLGITTPVGLFPGSRQTRLGLEDLAGNVWEWCDDTTEDWQGKPARVLRGGSFIGESGVLRASDRGMVLPEGGIWIGGFRCVLAPPRQA